MLIARLPAIIIISLLFLSPVTSTLTPTFAVVDPLIAPNNKFGIHIISPTSDEINAAAEMVNSNGGDWGYLTFLIENKDRDKDKWQQFFNNLKRMKLIPIVRIATQPETDPSTSSLRGDSVEPGQGFWKRPDENEAQIWAEFLNSLSWPVKNRYVVVYNEPNHGQEWGNSVDAKSYARILNQTIDALKQKSADFFVMNAGFDSSTPEERPRYQDQLTFMKEMSTEVPGIFDKLDGWASHSYPNPGFLGSPLDHGRRSIRGYLWELEVLRSLGVSKNLPVFITETGWKHSNGKNFNPRYPSPEIVAGYYKYAFESVWNDHQIVAVTPFLLNYQDYPFDHFSFKKIAGSDSNQVLGAEYPDFHPHYTTLASLSKPNGKPAMERKAELTAGSVYHSIVSNEEYSIPLTFKNVGQSIWNNDDPVRIVPLEGGAELGVDDVEIPKSFRIEPGREFTFNIKLKAPNKGFYKLVLNLFDGQDAFDNETFEFETQVKSPVSLKIKSKLKWKNSAAGDYLLKLYTVLGDQVQKISLNKSGQSEPIETRFVLPDYTFEYTLERDYYKPKTIRETLKSGENTLDFGTLEPNFLSTIFNLEAFWSLLPFSK